MKKKGMTLGLLLSGAGILILLYMTGESYLNGLAGSNRQMQADTKEYMYKYDMIVDNPESSFWQAVYASAEKWARENDSLLELKGTDEESQYTKLDPGQMELSFSTVGRMAWKIRLMRLLQMESRW